MDMKYMRHGSEGKNFYEEILAQSEYGYLAKNNKWKNKIESEPYDIEKVQRSSIVL